MAAYTTNTASATWNVSTHFTPNGIPTFGDQVTVANGHTLTIPSGYTAQCGDSAVPATPGLRTAGTGGTGILICNGKLEIVANVQQGNANWRFLGAGVKIESKNTTTELVWSMGDANNQFNQALTVTGTGVGNRAIVRNGVGAAGLRFAGAFNANSVVATWARFIDLGTSSTSGVELKGNHFYLIDTEFDTCGTLSFAGPFTNTIMTMQRVRIVNPKLGTNSLSMDIGPANYTGARTFEDVVIGAGVAFLTFPNSGTSLPTFTRCAFLGGLNRTSLTTVKGTFVDCHIHKAATTGSLSGAIGVGGDMTRGLVTVNAPTGTNWHGIAISTNAGGSVTCDGLVIDGVVQSENGDLLWVSRSASGAQTTIRNVLATRAPTTSGAYGKLVTVSGNTSFSASPSLAAIEHCTAYTQNGEASFIQIGDGVTAPNQGYTNVIGPVRHNLVVGLTAGTGHVFRRETVAVTNVVKDAFSAATTTDNAVFNAIANGTNGNGHSTAAGGDGLMWTGTIPSYTERTDTPQFVEERNLATWYRSLVGGTPGTRTADMALALEAIASQHSDSPVAGATIMAAWAWIRAGYAPQNAALDTNVSANNGGWQGAVEGVTVTTTPRRRPFLRAPKNTQRAFKPQSRLLFGATRLAAAPLPADYYLPRNPTVTLGPPLRPTVTLGPALSPTVTITH